MKQELTKEEINELWIRYPKLMLERFKIINNLTNNNNQNNKFLKLEEIDKTLLSNYQKEYMII